MISTFKNIIKNLSNIPGWRTQRKIVVIESDDWGSIRMPSLKAYETLKYKGLNIDTKNRPYNTLDTLASVEDFEALFATLSSFTDKNGNHPVFTAMALSANPDFKKIEDEQFTAYYYQTILDTLKDYNQEEAFSYWKKGEQQKLFVPEFHGREHLNVNLWMKALQQKDKNTLEAFHQGFWGFRPHNLGGLAYQSAFYLDKPESLDYHQEVIKSGVQLFEQLHSRKPSFFVPPNGAIHQKIIDTAVKEGMTYVSSPKIHKEPQGNGKTKKHFRYIGKKGKNNLIYLTRNCVFEPSYPDKGHSVKDCLGHIETAFKFKKPAVISSHRLNYIGGLDEANRNTGNKALKNLLTQILKKWPEVEFMTSVQLGKLIRNDKK
jgi:hypothetical protein